jgi:phage baseplate assembly protein W
MSFDLKLENGDVKIKAGDFAIVENSEKLVQDVLKIVSTPLGSNPFFPWYGSPISGSLVGTAFDMMFVESIATQQLTRAVERIQQLQQDQLRKSQIVTPQEQIAVVENVSVTRARNDPRFFEVQLTVLSRAFVRLQIPFAVQAV